MRKQTKLAVGLSAAALLAIGASMTSFAVTRGWVAEGDTWYYYDNNGDYVTDKWKSYNGNFFYLGEDGAMLTNQLIEDGENYYYVDANGVMVKNNWVAIAADEDEEEDVDYRWYYFGSTGKAYKNSVNKTINGKKYGFDENGKMLFGFTDDKGVSLNNDDNAVLQSTYYFGTNDDGARHNGWLRYEDGFENSDYDDLDYPYYWFFFNSNGKKQTTPKKIKGKNYNFNADGIMLTEWAGTKYYSGTVEDGSLKKNQWVYAIPDGKDDGEEWFRTDNEGNILRDQTKKINGQWYVFDDDGIMQSGLVALVDAQGKPVYKVSDAKFGTKIKLDDVSSELLQSGEDVVNNDYAYAYTGEGNLFYFSGSGDDGAMKTGSSIKISLADNDFTFGFAKTTGEALCGVQNNKVYWNGILQQAEDKYLVVRGGRGTDQSPADQNPFIHTYLVNNSGTRMQSEKYYKDDNDEYYVVKKLEPTDPGNNGILEDSDCPDGDDFGYIIYHVETLEVAKRIANGKWYPTKDGILDLHNALDLEGVEVIADGDFIID